MAEVKKSKNAFAAKNWGLILVVLPFLALGLLALFTAGVLVYQGDFGNLYLYLLAMIGFSLVSTSIVTLVENDYRAMAHIIA